MGELLGPNAFHSLDEVLNGGAEVVVRCRGRDGDGVVWHHKIEHELQLKGIRSLNWMRGWRDRKDVW